MTYKQLTKIASPHIRENGKIPSNSLLLLAQLHIPYKTEKECEDDFKGRISPLKSTPAFLYIDSNKDKTLYFSINTPYYNFYIFHEIAHYLLGHEGNSPQNEIDADMLACILAAPIENLPSYLKSARDLSSLCEIPIDKAEMYWQEIKDKFSKQHKKIWIIGCIAWMLILSIILFLCFNNHSTKENRTEETNAITTPDPNVNTYSQDTSFYITSAGTHYHKKHCQYVKYKTNIISISQEDADTLSLIPCEECIEK